MTVHIVVPDGIDDPARPSGGNVYDRRLSEALEAEGWDVHEHRVADPSGLSGALASLPARSTVLVDGLLGATADAMVRESERLRLVLLLHMPAAGRQVLDAVSAIVTTSEWTRGWVAAQNGHGRSRVHVAVPGVDPGPAAVGSPGGGRLLCVGPVTPAKGYDVLLAALGEISDLGWRCACVGALDIDPAFVDRLAVLARKTGIDGRLTFTGPLTAAQLEATRSETDLMISTARREAYGMAVAEGLARGIPVVVTSVGGHEEAVGMADDGSMPGLLVPPGEVQPLAAALRRWLTDAELRERLRASAARRRTGLATWADTARSVGAVLSRLGAVNPAQHGPV